jgi:hypothetical protein
MYSTVTARRRENVGRERRKIRLIEGNAKCRHLKKLTCKGTLRQVFISLRPRTHIPPPLHTQKRQAGGELNQREGERGNSSQSWVENTNMTQVKNSYKRLPQSPFKGQFI